VISRDIGDPTGISWNVVTMSWCGIGRKVPYVSTKVPYFRNSSVPGASSLSSLVDSRLCKISWICKMQKAICKGRVLPDGLGLNQCFFYWKNPSPDPGSAIWCASRVGLGIFSFLWTRVIVAMVDSFWDAGGQELKLWEQALLLLSSSSEDFLLGGETPF